MAIAGASGPSAVSQSGFGLAHSYGPPQKPTHAPMKKPVE